MRDLVAVRQAGLVTNSVLALCSGENMAKSHNGIISKYLVVVIVVYYESNFVYTLLSQVTLRVTH